MHTREIRNHSGYDYVIYDVIDIITYFLFQLLADNMEHVLINDEIFLRDFQFEFWSGYQMSDSCSFGPGLFRLPLLDALSRKDKVAISLEKNFAKCWATLVGKKYLEIDQSEIKQNISSSNIVRLNSGI